MLEPGKYAVTSSEFKWSKDSFQVELYTCINDQLQIAKETTPPARFRVEANWVTEAITRIQRSVNEKKRMVEKRV